MKWRKKVSIKVFWVGVLIAWALVLWLASSSPKEHFDGILLMCYGFWIGFITYAIATKVYIL
jgi:hypothetical protein